MMKYFIVVICCVLASSVYAENQKISLEDIEKDNVSSEKGTNPSKAPAGSPTDYGFLPVKTANDYARQQPKEAYFQPQYIPQQYTQKYSSVPQPQQYYYQQPQAPSPSSLYQQYENVQYVTDNSVNNQQQAYTNQPQYVYLQQYTAPSTSVQTVVDPKGGVQYVMYIPTYVQNAEQTQNYESVVYANGNPSQAAQYVTVPQTEVTPGIQYAQQSNVAEEEVASPKPKYYASKTVYTPKHEPKSLLDSYIPSVLQVQYYKQQEQARANALIQQSAKTSGPVVGKVDYVKTYRPALTHGSTSSESVVNYNYQIPTTYHK